MNWLKRVFQTKPSTALQATNDSNESILAQGCWYRANLSLTTPLEALHRHGEYFPGQPSNAPVISGGEYGGWAIRTNTFREMGIDLPEFSGTMASPIGYVSQDEVIPFLTAFRKIVESDSNHKTQIAELLALKKHPAHERYWKRFAKAYEDFPHSFFYIPLTQLPGVGRKTAKALYESGFHTSNDIGAASLEQLSSVPGLGKATASKLKQACGR